MGETDWNENIWNAYDRILHAVQHLESVVLYTQALDSPGRIIIAPTPGPATSGKKTL